VYLGVYAMLSTRSMAVISLQVEAKEVYSLATRSGRKDGEFLILKPEKFQSLGM